MNIREIARKASVSHSTVSRVINKVSTVDPKLARRVLAVIDEVGYRPNYQAQALARGRSHTVGLIVSELTGGNPFFSEIILYFERAAVEHGFEVLISFADTETDPSHVAVCANRMKERQVEGIAVLTFGMEQSLIDGEDRADLPIVFVGADRVIEGVRNIQINYLAGMREAVKHLADFGHKRIGYLSGQLSLSSMRMRYDALRKAFKAIGIAIDKGLIVECDHTLEGGFQGMSRLLSLPRPPTAVLCSNDMAAMGALRAMSLRKLHAGKDISVIGFDDLPICNYMQPPLSTIRFSPKELAILAFRALMDDIEGTEGKGEYKYVTQFVLRESTGAPRT
ncbi:LacI family DNA-binding transcriptional regulator [Edaphobacter bradus]|uniref:LacI family DNA-binding transcriptional regulator n=1 Tax=Edaphobacter bradus TaxID=2259016 RepID=UPI0021E07F66|nr:LacI family DNA-binding transcriptional regulator [Edaphobacter bradus]